MMSCLDLELGTPLLPNYRSRRCKPLRFGDRTVTIPLIYEDLYHDVIVSYFDHLNKKSYWKQCIVGRT